MSEVIDATARFRAKGGARPQQHRDLAEEALRKSARLLRADREIMAANLGGLAQEVSTAKPVEGARRMFERLGKDWESKWRKRKRLLILPGELPPKEDVLESGGATYLALARAAGELLAQGQGPAMVERSQHAAVRKLLARTSLAPAAPAVTKTLASGAELLAEALDRMAGRVVEQSHLPELWSVLEGAPFGISYVENEERETVRKAPLGEAQLLAEDLAGDIFWHPQSAKFDPSKEGIEWSKPFIEIGVIAVLRELNFFHVPPDLVPLFVLDEWNELVPAAEAWLEEHGSDEYSEMTGWGWKEQEFWQLYGVRLRLTEGPDKRGGFEISFYQRGDAQELVFRIGQIFHEDYLPKAAEQAHHFDEWRPFEKDNLGYVAVRSTWAKDEIAPFIGWAECSVTGAPDDACGAVTEPSVAPYVVSGEEVRFFPNFSADPTLPAPLPGLSLGAAILRSLADANAERRLEDLILEHATRTARAGLGFHEAVVEFYRKRLCEGPQA